MLSFKTILVFAQFFAFIEYGVAMKHAIFTRKPGKFLPDSVIAMVYADSELECSMHCTRLDACLSVNYKASGVDQGLCQLNNKTLSEKLMLVSDAKFEHLFVMKVFFKISQTYESQCMYNTIGRVNVHYVRTIQYWTKVLGHFFGYFKKTSYQTQNATMQSHLKFVIERNATFQFLAAFKVVVFKNVFTLSEIQQPLCNKTTLKEFGEK